MKRTEYTMVVIVCLNRANITRRVYVDENGEYFIKHNGEIRNVTAHKSSFIKA